MLRGPRQLSSHQSLAALTLHAARNLPSSASVESTQSHLSGGCAQRCPNQPPGSLVSAASRSPVVPPPPASVASHRSPRRRTWSVPNLPVQSSLLPPIDRPHHFPADANIQTVRVSLPSRRAG